MSAIQTNYVTGMAEPLAAQKTCLYDASQHPYRYCHHPALGVFRDKLYAMWSNGSDGEDEPGQRVMYAVSKDGLSWSQPMVLCESFPGKRGPIILTSAGFHATDEHMVAYVAAYELEAQEAFQTIENYCRPGGLACIDTTLYALVSEDGEHFSEPRDLHLPLCPNYGPQKLRSGRLLIAGNWTAAYTDDPSGLTGWTLRGFCPDDMLPVTPMRDDPGTLLLVKGSMGLEDYLCEGAFLEDEEGTLHMMYRASEPVLHAAESHDQGESWSWPVLTSFPNGTSKFFLGRLPDGRALYVGNVEKNGIRCPLILSVAEEGMCFTKHYCIESQPVSVKFEGFCKGGMYAYPHAAIYRDAVYIIYSICKEDVRVARIPLERLK